MLSLKLPARLHQLQNTEQQTYTLEQAMMNDNLHDRLLYLFDLSETQMNGKKEI